jgi:hypothetical protein
MTVGVENYGLKEMSRKLENYFSETTLSQHNTLRQMIVAVDTSLVLFLEA